MKTTPLQILIAENQYLIALEAERISNDACTCIVTICRRDALHTALDEQRYDLVFVDAAPTHEERAEQASAVQESGAALVFIGIEPAYVEALNPLGAFGKPFNEILIQRLIRRFCSLDEGNGAA